MKYLSVRTKLFILVLILLIPLISLQFYRIKTQLDNSLESELQASEELAQAISTSFSNYIEEVWHLETTIGIFLSDNVLKVDEINNYLRKVKNNQDICLRYSWIDNNGTIIASSEPSLIGKSFREQKYFKEILNGKDNVISDLDYSILDESPIIPIAKAIRKDGKLVGVVSTVINIDKLNMRLPNSRLTEHSSFGLVNRLGKTIYDSSNKNVIYEDSSASAESPVWNALKGEIVRSPRTTSHCKNFTCIRVDYPIKSIGWECYVTARHSEVLSKPYDDTKKDIIFLTILTLLSILAALIIGNYILSPIKRLESVALSIKNGDYSVQTGITGSDEISATAQAFDSMVKSIEKFDAMKTQFFTNISHELKTPLNVIYCSSQLLSNVQSTLDFDNLKSKVSTHLKVVNQNCNRLIRLINNILDITRIDNGFLEINLTNHDIVQVVEDITQSVVPYAELKNISCLFDTDIEEKVIACDPDMIERILLNLISNALKFTEENGYIYISICTDSDNVIISVRDTGIGIPKENFDDIFERFSQVNNSLNRSHEGSGIGLSLVKSLVEAHNGTITVESELGKGTEFIIKLPDIVLPEDDLQISHGQNGVANNVFKKIDVEFSDIIQ